MERVIDLYSCKDKYVISLSFCFYMVDFVYQIIIRILSFGLVGFENLVCFLVCIQLLEIQLVSYFFIIIINKNNSIKLVFIVNYVIVMLSYREF